MLEPLLEVDRLDAFYGDFQALFSVSMKVEAGETVAVIGANGAGKSTPPREHRRTDGARRARRHPFSTAAAIGGGPAYRTVRARHRPSCRRGRRAVLLA